MGSRVAHRWGYIVYSDDAFGALPVHSTLDDVPVLCPRAGAAAPSTYGSIRNGVQLCLGTCPIPSCCVIASMTYVSTLLDVLAIIYRHIDHNHPHSRIAAAVLGVQGDVPGPRLP